MIHINKKIRELQTDYTGQLARFGYRDCEGQYRCNSDICLNGMKRVSTFHRQHVDCVLAVISQKRWWSWNFEFNLFLDNFLSLMSKDYDASRIQWLECYDLIMQEMKEDKEGEISAAEVFDL